MKLAARYREEPVAGRVTVAEITLPDGHVVMSDATDVNEQLTKALDHEVTLWPLQPATDLAHYKHGPPDHPDFVDELRAMFSLEGDEPLPNLSAFPVELIEYESLPGTYYDAFPLLILTDSALAAVPEAGTAVGHRRAPVPAERGRGRWTTRGSSRTRGSAGACASVRRSSRSPPPAPAA